MDDPVLVYAGAPPVAMQEKNRRAAKAHKRQVPGIPSKVYRDVHDKLRRIPLERHEYLVLGYFAAWGVPLFPTIRRWHSEIPPVEAIPVVTPTSFEQPTKKHD